MVYLDWLVARRNLACIRIFLLSNGHWHTSWPDHTQSLTKNPHVAPSKPANERDDEQWECYCKHWWYSAGQLSPTSGVFSGYWLVGWWYLGIHRLLSMLDHSWAALWINDAQSLARCSYTV